MKLAITLDSHCHSLETSHQAVRQHRWFGAEGKGGEAAAHQAAH